MWYSCIVSLGWILQEGLRYDFSPETPILNRGGGGALIKNHKHDHSIQDGGGDVLETKKQQKAKPLE